jgi:L-ascorbate metabolism protein UlaG (beta-lactamase superfamily)
MTGAIELFSDTTEANFTAGSIQFIGTATVLIRFAGFTILTDPNFLHRGDHVHLGYGLKSFRITDPAIDIENLPPLDFVVLSHMHEDHFDRVAAEKLSKTLPIITTRPASADLRKKGFTEARGLDRWAEITLSKGEGRVRITALPARHGPPLVAAALPTTMGSLLSFSRGQESPLFRLYITGDTLYYEDLKEIPARFPDIDLALIHLGGTTVLGIMVTMDAAQGVKTIQLVRPRVSIPIHYDDYIVFKSSLEDFQRAVEEAGLSDRVRYLARGETYRFEVS